MAAEGRSVILLLGHCGCWEWAQEISVRYKAPKRGGEIYKHIPNRLVEELMNALRAHWDTTLIEMRQAVRTVLRWHKEGEPFLVGFISDQRAYTAAKRWTVFMNQITDFVSGGEELAAKIGAEVLYLDIEKPKRGYYRLTFKQVHPEQTDVDAPYTRQFYKMLEETIRRRPSLWLWSHNRWRNNHECPEEIKNRLMKSKI
ncbi:MAG: lysophospholipid acyltransferase family protein [Bacteroidales bacterium]|nr:lysophospholipid acyltransferase family protein [Candidatus Physcousia equi]